MNQFFNAGLLNLEDVKQEEIGLTSDEFSEIDEKLQEELKKNIPIDYLSYLKDYDNFGGILTLPSERKVFTRNAKATLLKIPIEYIEKYPIKEDPLFKFMCTDAFIKNKNFWWHDEEEPANTLEALFDFAELNSLAYNKTLYILGDERLQAVLRIKAELSEEKKRITEDFNKSGLYVYEMHRKNYSKWKIIFEELDKKLLPLYNYSYLNENSFVHSIKSLKESVAFKSNN